MLRQEMDLAYFDMIHRPGEKLGIQDNQSDFDSCAEKTHCNATHASFAPRIVWNEEEKKYVLDDTGLDDAFKDFLDIFKGRRHTLLNGGEHNNVYFPGFYHYKKNLPESLMQDINGDWLVLHDKDIMEGRGIPMPAIDDPQLLKLNAEALAKQAERMPGLHQVACYKLGFEMLYPEYFNLGNGDYRPVSWAHFTAWCREHSREVPAKEDTLKEGSEARTAWLHFREQAMADRAGYYYRAVLNKDNTHLSFYPTHGSTLCGNNRARLGQQPDTLTAVCDGMEMGHILIDDDAERRNVIMTCLYSSYGSPVIVPRVGNKTPDLGATGGGRSFTPDTLRRLLYEDVGMGISIIFPIAWRSHLHDGEWFIKNTPAEAECKKIFDEITLAAPYMTHMGRMQPQLGVLASDDTWLDKWDPRWTAFMQDALARRVNLTIITDSVINAAFARKMPVLLLLADKNIAAKTAENLLDYLNAGGRVVIWGEFGTNLPEEVWNGILSHENCMVSTVPECKKDRILREMFLTGMFEGTWGESCRFKAPDNGELLREIAAFAPDAVLYPFETEGMPGETNLYALTDRAGIGCVCVNNGNDKAVFTVRPAAKLLRNTVAIDMLTGEKLEMPVTLAPHATKMIYFGKRVKQDDVEETVWDAEQAYKRWKDLGCDIGAVRGNYSCMRTGWHHTKRYALAEALLHTMALKTDVEKEADGTLVLTARAFDAQGQEVTDAAVTARMVPGDGGRMPFTYEDGRYVCRVTRDRMVKVYSPEENDYVPLSGMTRIILTAENDTLAGGCMVHTEV